MRITYFRTGHVTDVTSGHVTSGPDPPHDPQQICLFPSPYPNRKGKLKCEMIWTIYKKDKSNSDKIWTMRQKSKLNCEKIQKIWKKGNFKCEVIWTIVKRYGKYRRKVGSTVK